MIRNKLKDIWAAGRPVLNGRWKELTGGAVTVAAPKGGY